MTDEHTEPTDALIIALHGVQVDGWTCHWEYPGHFEWSRADKDYWVCATPDADEHGKIDMQASMKDGCPGELGPLVPYKSSPLTATEYLELVTPFLKTAPDSPTWRDYEETQS